MNVAIELPKEIARSLAGPDEDLSRIALEALAAHGYRDGKLSHSEVQHLLGFNSVLKELNAIETPQLVRNWATNGP